VDCDILDTKLSNGNFSSQHAEFKGSKSAVYEVPVCEPPFRPGKSKLLAESHKIKCRNFSANQLGCHTLWLEGSSRLSMGHNSLVPAKSPGFFYLDRDAVDLISWQYLSAVAIRGKSPHVLPSGKRRGQETETLSTSAFPKEAERPSAAVAAPKSAGAGSLADRVIASLEEAKAEDVVSIDLRGKTALADSMIVATGRSSVHVGAIADRAIKACKAAGHGSPRVEGLPQCDWVLVDAGDLIVHIFRPEVRQFYNLEKMWGGDRPREMRLA
jgi:ribosome-associated protein